MVNQIQSRPFKPTAACEMCVFGTGAHAYWCPIALEEHIDWLYRFENQDMA